MTKKILMCKKHFLPKPCKVCESMKKKLLKTVMAAHCPTAFFRKKSWQKNRVRGQKCREKFIIEVRGMKE